MNMQTLEKDSDQIVRVSLVWLIVGIVVVVLLGAGGGMAANQLWPTQKIPLTNEKEQFVTTVQEVKISPNKAAAEIVSTADRSIIGIRAKSSLDNSLIATGVVTTNDGLAVTSAVLPKVELVAVDWQGIDIPVSLVGRDELFGLTYLRIEESVISPLDVRSGELPVGNELLLLSRAKNTGLARADNYRVNEWVLPPEISPKGVQQLLKGTMIGETVLPGGVLIDEETKIAGVVLNGQAGLALGGNAILTSMQRVAANQREANIFNELGINTHYALERDGEKGRRFVVEIVGVLPISWAEESGLKARDKILAINGEALSWQKAVVNQLKRDGLRQITIRRGENDLVIEVGK